MSVVPPTDGPTAPQPTPVTEPTSSSLVPAVVVLSVLVLLMAAGGAAYLAYAHPGSREPLVAAGAVLAILVPLVYSVLRR
ncbi:hypothetical protein ACFQ7W_37370 [Streptomyces niveus]|uniref:hypothetical protein n=1 Tax=Streptomyces niveus TaxID=193462 RepID=UPI003680D1DC